MAHDVKVKRVPYLKKDGTVSEKKRRYAVVCSHRANKKKCLSEEVASMAAAEELVEAHHSSVREIHRMTHPNQKSGRPKNGPTRARRGHGAPAPGSYWEKVPEEVRNRALGFSSME
jgi:hypothetical protein